MRTTTFITGILTKFQEILDVQVPCFDVSTHRALALTALIDSNSCVIGDLKERNNALATTVGALNARASCTHISPIITQAAGPFRELRIISDAFEDVFK